MAQRGENQSAYNAKDTGDAGLTLGGEDPLEESIEPTSVFLPGESHRQRSLLGYSS